MIALDLSAMFGHLVSRPRADLGALFFRECLPGCKLLWSCTKQQEIFHQVFFPFFLDARRVSSLEHFLKDHLTRSFPIRQISLIRKGHPSFLLCSSSTFCNDR